MRYFIILLFVFCVQQLHAQTTYRLVNEGKCNSRILIASDADSSHQRAASILQQYFQKISGVIVPIVNDRQSSTSFEIIIGKTRRTNIHDWKKITSGLKNEGYILQSGPRQLLLSGDGDRGIIHAVTGFLEDYLGCRKYSPDLMFTPTLQTISIGQIHDRQIPPAGIRIINGSFAADTAYKDWRKLNTVAEKWNDGNWRGYYVHTFNRFVPSQQYFEKHPEYFALVNGKRVPYGQLCLTNPAVFEITIQQLKQEMAAHPGVQYWSVSQNDNYDYCQCADCKKRDDLDGGPTGTLLEFVNKVARLFPDKTITTLAYQYTRKPPLHTKPAPNVLVTLCTIELGRSLPIETAPGATSFKNDMEGWSKICRNIMVWDYEVQFTNYLCPFPLFHTLQPNIQFFNRNGATAHFQQCNAVHGVEFAELKTYLLSKLLWNPDADADAIINDFMKGYYGAAAPFIKQYVDLLHAEARASKQELDIYGTPVWNAKTFLSEQLIQKYYHLFDQAEAAVKDHPEQLERVKIDRLCVQYADMEIAKSDMFGERGWYEIKDNHYLMKPERKKLLEDFYETCKRNQIVRLDESSLTADIYYQNTLRFIDVQTEGNLAFKKPVTCDPMPAAKYTGNGTSVLTNGVRGTEDYKVNWLGWEANDVTVRIDLEKINPVKEIVMSSLQYPKSWILHPLRVHCLISEDGVQYQDAGTIAADSDLQKEPQIKSFVFNVSGRNGRFIKLEVTGTKTLPAWHNYVGNKSWVFIDEVVVK